MELPVLIEPLPNGGFRARLGQPLEIAADGPTKEDAVAALRKLLQDELNQGKQIASIQIPSVPPPWLRYAGMFKEDDPIIQEWVKCIQEYRDEVENDPNYL